MTYRVGKAEILAIAALFSLVFPVSTVTAGPFAARPIEGGDAGAGDPETQRDGGMDEQYERRGRAPDRDDPSEDGTGARRQDEGEPPSGCLMREGPLELLV